MQAQATSPGSTEASSLTHGQNLSQDSPFCQGKIAPALLTAQQAQARLNLSHATFYRLLPRLRAKGLRIVKFPSPRRPMVRFTAKSIDALIDKAAKVDGFLC
jgi:hypothetical protein